MRKPCTRKLQHHMALSDDFSAKGPTQGSIAIIILKWFNEVNQHRAEQWSELSLSDAKADHLLETIKTKIRPWDLGNPCEGLPVLPDLKRICNKGFTPDIRRASGFTRSNGLDRTKARPPSSG